MTSTASWHPVTLDLLLVLVTPCPLGSEPDLACPRAHRGEGAPECSEKPVQALLRWGQPSAQLGLQIQPPVPRAPPVLPLPLLPR